METAQKARRTRAALYPVLNRLSPIPVRTKLSIYQKYVRTIITPAGPAWAALISNANWRRLEAVQNIALRTITGSQWFVRNSLQQSNYSHLQNIGKMSGPPERNRNRPGELTRRT
ncbi:putative RNA-directed DNA polymerase [Aphis craccivora]|uniref:Putative RNA-directed DNA polymerase n=1 Tax=Aphis craccivora TaxID=307492 RepID=A0A6G0Y5L8_APHCR|nr:putative RNA-directed DNA polymerase [Aphis craccivora]